MAKNLNTEAKRFKLLRQELGFTQQAFAEELGIKGSVADIERGKSRISGEVVATLFERYRINPLWLFGKSEEKHLQSEEVQIMPKVVTLNTSEHENIVLVNAKVSAGYAHNLQDPEWYDTLPAFSLPLPEYRNATYRGFQVEGNSMYPVLHSGEWVIAQAEEKLSDLRPEEIYVVVLQDSLVVKKIVRQQNRIQLVSVNPEYPTIETRPEDIREIWRVVSKISGVLEPAPNLQLDHWAQEIKNELKEIREHLK
ncbi:XRE family transcriptional regulator [Sinomicrobium sp.]